jgi:hypothetical protein
MLKELLFTVRLGAVDLIQVVEFSLVRVDCRPTRRGTGQQPVPYWSPLSPAGVTLMGSHWLMGPAVCFSISWNSMHLLRPLTGGMCIVLLHVHASMVSRVIHVSSPDVHCSLWRCAITHDLLMVHAGGTVSSLRSEPNIQLDHLSPKHSSCISILYRKTMGWG